MDWLYLFPCLPVPLALGLHKVTRQCGSLVSYVPWYVLTVDRGPEENLLAWGKLRKGTSSVGLVKLESPVMEDLSGLRHVGPNWGQMEVLQNGFKGFLGWLGCVEHSFYGPDLSHYKAIGPWEVGRGCAVLYVVMH